MVLGRAHAPASRWRRRVIASHVVVIAITIMMMMMMMMIMMIMMFMMRMMMIWDSGCLAEFRGGQGKGEGVGEG